MRLLFLLLVCLQSCLSLNILLFLLGTTQFERNNFEFLAQQLALRHHEVITVKPILIPEEPRLVKPKLHLVKEKTLKNLLPKSLYEPIEKMGNEIPWRQTYSEFEHEIPYWAGHNYSCYKMLNSNLMDSLKKESLDVAIVYAGNPCQLAICHVLGVPVIYYDVEGISEETAVAARMPLYLNAPTSCSLPNTPHCLSRLVNGFCLFKEYIAQSNIPVISSLVSKRVKLLDDEITKMFAEDYTLKKRFKSFPNVNELKQQSSLFFVNTDPLLEYPRALPPHVIPVAGLQLDHPKPLFSPWNTTIASAEEGLIIVSLGTTANSTAMTSQQAKAILGALSKLTKYRIYWRIGPIVSLPGIKEEDVPSHINLTAFIPQNDLIAHKTCRLLITNGGMSSIMEAVAYGVPMVGIPLFGRNRDNLGKVVNKGLGLVVNKAELSEATLSKAIKTVLESAKYKTIAKDMSKEFKSRLSSPFNIALHYIEHVGKHHKAAFLQPSTTEALKSLNFDFHVVLVSLLFIFSYLICLLIPKVIMAPFGFLSSSKTCSKVEKSGLKTAKDSKKER